jgi:predicted negative regulator of RcsB-dependent stress response
VDDYLSETEQWEALKKWFRENGLWIVAGVAVGAAAIGGWQWRNAHIDRVNGEAGTKYESMIKAFGSGDQTQGMSLLGEIERDYSSTPYVDQAKLAAARVYVESNRLDKAAEELQSVSQQSKDKQLALLARARLARVQIAQKKPDDALATLNGVDPGAFGSQFHEVRGDALLAKGDKAGALTEYRAARASDLGGGGGGADSLLELKISDLMADAAPLPAAAKTPITPSTQAAQAQTQAKK